MVIGEQMYVLVRMALICSIFFPVLTMVPSNRWMIMTALGRLCHNLQQNSQAELLNFDPV